PRPDAGRFAQDGSGGGRVPPLPEGAGAGPGQAPTGAAGLEPGDGGRAAQPGGRLRDGTPRQGRGPELDQGGGDVPVGGPEGEPRRPRHQAKDGPLRAATGSG